MKTKQPQIELCPSLAIDPFQSRNLSYDSFDINHREAAWATKRASASEKLAASAALKIYSKSGSTPACHRQAADKNAIRALALDSTLLLPGDLFSIALPSTLFDEKKQKLKEARAHALFHQVATLGYKQIVLGSWTDQLIKSDSQLDAKGLLQQLQEMAVGCDIELFIKPIFHTETLSSSIADKTIWQRYLQKVVAQFHSLHSPLSILWPSIWHQEAIDSAIVAYDADACYLMSCELSYIEQLKAKTIWYMPASMSCSHQQGFIDLLPYLPKNCSLLFHAAIDERSFSANFCHPLFDYCALLRQNPLYSLLPLLDISSWLFGKGLYPIDWPLLLQTFLQNIEAAQMKGAILLIPSMPQPQSWLWGSLWTIGQKLCGSRLTSRQLLSLWSRALGDSDSNRIITEAASQLTYCNMSIASLFASDTAHTTKKSHYEALLDTLEALTPSTSASLTLSEKSLLFACQEIRRLTFYLAQKAKLNFNAQHKESDLEEGLFTSMTASQTISKISLIEIHPQPRQPAANFAYYDVWLKANHYWEQVV